MGNDANDLGRRLRGYASALLLLGTLPALGATSDASAVLAVDAGGVLAIPLPEGVQTAHYGDEPALVVAGHAIVGVEADAPAGTRQLRVQTAAGQETIAFEVRQREFPEQHITIANDRLVNPDPAALARHRRERIEQDAAYALRTVPRTELAPFLRPTPGPLSSLFGFRRVFNGQPRARHSGLDIAAPVGTPVRVPAPATVAAVGDYYFNGNTVMLDHGGGLVTMYCHLETTTVTVGETVARGDVLGTVGATGRATGPHLHWTASLQDVRVDPLALMAVFTALADGASPAGDGGADGR